jgi:hypothetical protein
MDVIRAVLPVMRKARNGVIKSARNAMSAGLTDYQPFIQRSTQAFSRMSAARLIDSGDVARVVYEAATDGSDRLRYLVATTHEASWKARAALADQEYVDFIRSHFRDDIGKS